MAAYAPMPYSPSMPYAVPPPPSYALPPYAAQSTYGDSQSAPIPLAPLVVPGALEDTSAGGGGGGGGGMVTKFLALPLIVVLPILIPIIVIVVVVAGGGGGGGGGNKNPALGSAAAVPGKNENYESTPYYDDNSYGNDYQDNNNNYNDNRPHQGYNNRHRRQTEKNKNIPATSSALPSMSVAQVERLTQVVYAALNSQECIQRLLCEVGSLSRSFSDSTRTVTKAVEEYVPEKLKDSFNVFAKAEKCEQYKCGSLKAKK
ncbi:uncharacterized protein LOC124197491 [Daphnia pulex]|uniref:uncharacterized protein LOC124197491 n=1 Tax=Daphnia pulex TaxID=6669 RepID=UPI001EDD1A26|nr:uncharacterized protein LOC124197491 [Daphnia pulex]